MVDLAANAEKALRMVRESRFLSYDTEGSGVDWRKNNPIGYVIGAPRADLTIAQEDVVYVPVRHGGGGNLMGCRPLTTAEDKIEIHPFEKELAKAFDQRNQDVTKERTVGHNLKFDVHFSANAGINLGRKLACTQDRAAMLDEYQRSYSLSSCSERAGVTAKLGEGLYEHLARQFGGPAKRDQMGNYWRLAGNDPIGYDYAVGDGVSTWELYAYQQTKIDEEDMTFIANMEADLIWTVFRMERRGIKVDVDRIQELREKTERQIALALGQFKLGFNTRSPLDVKAAMEAAGHTDWPLTEKGAPSFTQKFLEKNEVGKRIINIRQMTNLLNTFVNPLEERHMFKGRVHATLNQLKSDDKGTISGRFSCSDPNLQQVPKHNKALAIPFRRLFVADEGYTFWERDFSQCEPRLFAHYSQDENLVNGYNAEPFVDAHTTTATLLGVERDPTAKRMNMGIFTGMQPRALAGHMGISVELAERYHRQWFGTYPSVRKFQNAAKARLRERGYVFTLLGRRCRLEDHRFAYRGTSKIIQGSNADIVKLKLLEADMACEAAGDIVQVHMTVHDSYNGQYQNTPEALALWQQIEHDMQQVMCPPYNMTVPFVLEGTEGGDWAEATFGAKKVAAMLEAA